jgi:hypothetical protein
MTYFDYFVAAAWIFIIGWFSGAIYFQNRSEKAESPRLIEDPEPRPNSETRQLPAALSAGD